MDRIPLSRSAVLAVVGAGPAGVSAAVEAARLGFDTVVFDMDGEAGGSIRHAFEVRNFPGAASTGIELAGLFSSLIGRWGIGIERRRITGVQEKGRSIVLSDSGSAETIADAAVIATGTSPLLPAIPGLSVGDSGWLLEFATDFAGREPGSKAAVVGGSDVAFDQARYLASLGAETVVICRSPIPRAPGWLVSAAQAEGVSLLAGASVLRVARCGTRHSLLVDRDARNGSPAGGLEEMPVDCMLLAAGRAPRTSLAGGRLSSARVAVAGDAAGRAERYVSVSMSEGCLAARRLLRGHVLHGGDD
jgi:thioredoxin reductase (NADPH)